MKVPLLAALILPVLAFAQSPPADTSPVNLLKNGNFELFTQEDNLWDGVDSEGFLAGDAGLESIVLKKGSEKPRGIFFRPGVGQWDAILEAGNVGRLSMPISVQVADLNKDGCPDILTLDGAGYFRVYFNSGTPTEPKFTHCEMVPLFMNRFFGRAGINAEGGLKACLGDFDNNGSLDLVIGTYIGRILLIKNTGTPLEWRQPQSIESVTIPTARNGLLWANHLAPAVVDWNKDGRPDLLVGEGSYSANAVHLLLNMGGGFGASSGQFTEDGREYLAYGDGREQLVPAVGDYNGDGFPDLFIADRLGNIYVHLSEGPWKKGVELKRQEKPVNFGGAIAVGSGGSGKGCVFPAIGDLNGDGKLDILVGRCNGRIAVSYNLGTDKEPKFGPLVEMKGEDVFNPGTIREPRIWSPNFGYKLGNFYGYYSVVTPQEDPEAAPTTSKNVIKFGYHSVLNKLIRKPPMLLAGIDTPFPQALAGYSYIDNRPAYWGNPIRNASEEWSNSNVAVLQQTIDPGSLKPNTNYMLSFKVKGRGVKTGHAAFALGGWLIRDLAKYSSRSPANQIADCVQQELNFNVSPNWTTVTKQLSFKFQKQNDLNDPAKWTNPNSKLEYRGFLDIRAAVNIDEGTFYIDDARLTPL